MAAGHREDRRMLALDVWRLVTDKKIETEAYILRGAVHEWRSDYPLPDNPLLHAEIERINREGLGLRQRQQAKDNGHSKPA